jgi:hypothetical protein
MYKKGIQLWIPFFLCPIFFSILCYFLNAFCLCLSNQQEKDMKKYMCVLLLAFLCGEAKCYVGDLVFEVRIDPRNTELTKEMKDSIWVKYLSAQSLSWLHFNISLEEVKDFPYSKFYLKRHFSKQICAFLQSEGVGFKNVKIEFSKDPHVVVYKAKAKMQYANFVYDDPKNKQVFLVNNNEGSVCETVNGNRIRFSPGAFLTKGGNEVKVEVYEYTSVNDFVMSGYTSTATDKLISSSGMFNIQASCNGAEVGIRKAGDCKIEFPAKNFTDTNVINDFQTFYGNNSDEVVNWKPNNTFVSDARKSTNKGGRSRRRGRQIRQVTELFYVSICYNLPILESRYSTVDKTTAKEDLVTLVGGGSLRSRCDYGEKDYNFIVSKYKLQKRNNKNEMDAISSYREFTKLMLNNRKDVFLLLTPEQNADLMAYKNGYQNKQKKKQEELKRMAADHEKVAAAMKEADMQKFPIEMQIEKLGRINCDRFMEDVEKTNIIVKLDQFDFDEIRVYAVFNDIKSVIPAKYQAGSKSGYVQFFDLPVDRAVLYVAATFKGDKVKLAYIHKEIKKKDVVSLNLTTYSKSNYEAIMKDIIPN